MASASGPAGRPEPSVIRGRSGVSSSDRTAGERHESQVPTATASPNDTAATAAPTSAFTTHHGGRRRDRGAHALA
jgi:hypothetical protein